MQRAFNDESEYFRRRKEDENKYLVARAGDGLIAPFQCDHCWFINLKQRVPLPSSIGDKYELALIRRANLDLFWSRESRTISKVVNQLRQIISRAENAGRRIPLEPFTPWDLDEFQDMGIAIIILERSIEKGRLNDKYLQFASIRPLRGAASDVYAATAQATRLRYAMKTSRGDVTHLYDGAMQTNFMERVMKGMKTRMPEDSERNKPFSSVMILYILHHLELEYLDPSTPQARRRMVLMTAAYLCATFGYSLRGCEGLWMDAWRLRSYIHIGKSDPKAPHVLIALVGRFKAEEGDRMHVLPLANVSRSGIQYRIWLERLAHLLDQEERTNCPAFCDEEGYQLTPRCMEDVFHPILERMQLNPKYAEEIPPGLDVRKWWRADRSMRRGAEIEALNAGIGDTTINFVHHWGRIEKNRGAEPGFDMLEHYVSGVKTRYLQIKFSASL